MRRCRRLNSLANPVTPRLTVAPAASPAPPAGPDPRHTQMKRARGTILSPVRLTCRCESAFHQIVEVRRVELFLVFFSRVRHRALEALQRIPSALDMRIVR